MPGTVTSMPKSGLPVTIIGLSTPRIGCADDLVVLRVLERDRLRDRAPAASRPWRRARRRRATGSLPRWCTTPRARRCTRLSGTPQVCAAAATSICRPAAPTRRIGSQWSAASRAAARELRGRSFVVVERRLLDPHVFQSTSSSSAISIGQHRLDALADLGVLGDDRDDAVGGDADEGVRREVGDEAVDRRGLRRARSARA